MILQYCWCLCKYSRKKLNINPTKNMKVLSTTADAFQSNDGGMGKNGAPERHRLHI